MFSFGVRLMAQPPEKIINGILTASEDKRKMSAVLFADLSGHEISDKPVFHVGQSHQLRRSSVGCNFSSLWRFCAHFAKKEKFIMK